MELFLIMVICFLIGVVAGLIMVVSWLALSTYKQLNGLLKIVKRSL